MSHLQISTRKAAVPEVSKEVKVHPRQPGDLQPPEAGLSKYEVQRVDWSHSNANQGQFFANLGRYNLQHLHKNSRIQGTEGSRRVVPIHRKFLQGGRRKTVPHQV